MKCLLNFIDELQNKAEAISLFSLGAGLSLLGGLLGSLSAESLFSGDLSLDLADFFRDESSHDSVLEGRGSQSSAVRSVDLSGALRDGIKSSGSGSWHTTDLLAVEGFSLGWFVLLGEVVSSQLSTFVSLSLPGVLTILILLDLVL